MNMIFWLDKLVKLSNGKGSAFYTDPMQADDYKTLLGKSVIGNDI